MRGSIGFERGGNHVHELSICEHILGLAIDAAEKAGAKKIVRVRVKHGELRSIVPDILSHYFSFLAKDTIAAEAKLEMEPVKPKALCNKCKNEFDITEFNFKCTSCGAQDTQLLSGMELFLEDIEVQD